jgi:hypothetical protein
MGRRVVVTAFDVELVDLQFQPPIPRQLIFKPPISISPVPMAIQVIGLGRRNTRMTEEQQQALAAGLYQAFLQDLRQHGLELVSQDVLLASPGYAKLRKMSVVRSSPLMVLNPLGSDTGIVMHTRTMAAPGLVVVQETRLGRGTADAEILQETRADVALAVKLRVGIFQGKPALEHRSVIRVTTREGQTTLSANHSLVSDLVATDATRFRPIVGRIEPVDSDTFSHELTAMLPKFIAPAFVASKP